MSEHTPGPLHVTWGSKTETSFGLEIQDASDNLIAQLWWDEGEDYPSVEATWANAALFAAAPDLLEACAALMVLLLELVENADNEDALPRMADMLVRVTDGATRAIKKAKEVGSE